MVEPVVSTAWAVIVQPYTELAEPDTGVLALSTVLNTAEAPDSEDKTATGRT